MTSYIWCRISYDGIFFFFSPLSYSSLFFVQMISCYSITMAYQFHHPKKIPLLSCLIWKLSPLKARSREVRWSITSMILLRIAFHISVSHIICFCMLLSMPFPVRDCSKDFPNIAILMPCTFFMWGKSWVELFSRAHEMVKTHLFSQVYYYMDKEKFLNKKQGKQ